MNPSRHRQRRSVLFVPASSEKAIAKLPSLACDAVVFDLEDAVAPEAKEAARERLRAWFAARPKDGPELVIRVNPLDSEWGTEDLLAARACAPDAVLLPKVDTPRDIHDFDDALDKTDAPADLKLWVMIETPKAMLNVGALAELGRDAAARLDCFVAGTNDLAKETGVLATPDRRYLTPWLMQMVLAARAGGLTVLDGVSNDFRDLDAFARECAEGAAMGFDGKTLIHPGQIEPARAAFSPSAEAVAEAQAIRAAFALPENAGKGVISIGGRMVERLHLAQAERLLARAGRL
ncbi:HpcH/HpaI aldolase/citrate lyase family protein [Mesorhizobium marinum]|uniref:HpcH/HpaI aldolase/citrate lyase family protein n=1 Tax=Mesorhizobium marinum TaxID=3228790 RepID=UPI0034678997